MDKEHFVFLVKFDRGYYAAKQPNYYWSYTNDVADAYKYSTEKAATKRGKWGISLMHDPCADFVVEKYKVVTSMYKVE